ncbi:C45 family autoproteolytic acyltransferase/hydolase [Evansella clarkii]|uniref:C45 family autoproteolytic acyltransferase/hydolase n=1 Tax=Evansella clarkii TaxID=79879 RepID=UPI0009973FE3|nr:C45 family peptidase [Evansella clarkii]
MKELHLKGTPFEIGLQHGIAGKEEVHYSLSSYERMFKGIVGLSWEEATEMAKGHLEAIESYQVDYIEEMQGIAKGAGVKFEDILVLNARSEIALTKNATDGCTSLAIMKPLGANTYLGQNWDWRPSQINSLLLTKIEQKYKPDICMVTEGGIIGKIGFNSLGLGVCLNAIRANVKSNAVPIHLGLRSVLDSRTLNEALSKVTNKQMASSANFLIGYDNGGSGEAVNIEVSPEGEDYRTTKDRALYHTNHLCSPKLIERIGKDNLINKEHSFNRIDRMKELVKHAEEKNEVVNQDKIKDWFTDHSGFPRAICRHEEQDQSDYEQTRTVFSVIMNLEKGSMFFIKGNPCTPINYKTVALEQEEE